MYTRAMALAMLTLPLACSVEAGQAASATRFTRDPARFRANQDKLVAALRQQSPEFAAQIESGLRRQDILRVIQPDLARMGLDSQDMADMMAAYWITAWEAARGMVGHRTDPALARGARDQLRRNLARDAGKVSAAERQDLADMMLLQALVASWRMDAAAKGGPGMVKRVGDQIAAEASALTKVDFRRIALTPAGFTNAEAGSAAPSESAPLAGGTAKLSGLYFRAIYGLGAAIDFEPLALYPSGDYVEIGDTPPERIDPARGKPGGAINWGRWRKEGGTFLFTNHEGRTSDYKLGSGSFFPAFPAEQGPPLSGRYSRTTSGGDYMVGGGTMVMAVGKLTFLPGGRFTEGLDAGGIAPNAAFSRRAAGAGGRYKLSGTTLELAYDDGRVRRTSFAYGASGTPPRPDPDMVFIGGDAYIRD